MLSRMWKAKSWGPSTAYSSFCGSGNPVNRALSLENSTLIPPLPLVTGSAKARFHPVSSAMAAMSASGVGSPSKVWGTCWKSSPLPMYSVRITPSPEGAAPDTWEEGESSPRREQPPSTKIPAASKVSQNRFIWIPLLLGIG